MRRALVTGGSGALGAAICRRLAAAGHHVYVHAHGGAARAERVAAEITAAGGSAVVVVFDVTDAVAAGSALETLAAAGAIQILVNNAGIHDDAVMPGMRHDQWSRVIDVSLNGFFNVTQPLLLPMIRTRWGRIVNLSSVAALAGNRGQTNYAAAKAGLHGATRALALELASRGISHVEDHHLNRAAGGGDLGCDPLGASGAAVGMHVDVVTRRGKSPTDGGAECAATPGDQCPPHSGATASTTAARPLSTSVPEQSRAN